MQETVYKSDIPVSIALVSDLHNRPFEHIIASLKKNEPDIIAIAGDLVYGDVSDNNVPIFEQEEYALPFLKECAALAKTYMSLGNHESLLCNDDIDIIKGTGVCLLDNEWEENDKIAIGGLSSAYVDSYRKYRQISGENTRYLERKKRKVHTVSYKKSEKTPNTSWLKEYEASDKYKILLSHHPEYWSFLKTHNIDLILAGHAHGGQWRIGDHGIFASGQGFWPKLTSGIITEENTHMVISRGLSNTAPVPRINNPTEIVFVVPDNNNTYNNP